MSKTYTLTPTKHPDLFRVVDRDGNWEHYFHQPSNTYLRGVTTILSKGYAKGYFFEEWLLKITPAERDQILKSAGEKGDKVHRTIDLLISSEPNEEGKVIVTRETGVFSRETQDYESLSNGEWDDLLTFSKFWNAHKPIVIKSEMPFFSLRDGFAGTGDAILILTEECGIKTCKCKGLVGKIGLFDWKTSSGIRPSYSAQLSAYTQAENVKDYLPEGAEIEFTAIIRLGTAHKTTGGYEMALYLGANLALDARTKAKDDTKKLREIDLATISNGWKRFNAARVIADFEYSPFDGTAILDIPDTIEITFTKQVEAPRELAKGLADLVNEDRKVVGIVKPDEIKINTKEGVITGVIREATEEDLKNPDLMEVSLVSVPAAVEAPAPIIKKKRVTKKSNEKSKRTSRRA